MTSSRGGSRRKRTSAVEVANISKHGFWLLIENKEHFVPFKEFPWFQKAAIGELLNVELASPRHLYWPDLDVDLSVESIDFPERFPLVSKQRPQRPARQQQKNGKPARG
jgi:uncharacterized protein DUF2442